MTPTNAFWIAPAPDESGVALPEGTVELDPAADEAAVAELALPELEHPASASAAAATAARAAGHLRQGGEPARGCPDDCCGDGDENHFCTMHHYRIARS
jgi:hypothetical protein